MVENPHFKDKSHEQKVEDRLSSIEEELTKIFRASNDMTDLYMFAITNILLVLILWRIW